MAQVTYLLDTNVLSEIIRPSPTLSVMRLYAKYRQALAISSVTWHEALYGLNLMSPGKRKDRIGVYLREVIAEHLSIVAYDKTAARWHAAERVRLKALGFHLHYADGQIAATAATRGLILVTRNTKDFLRLDGLRLEDWFDKEGVLSNSEE